MNKTNLDCSINDTTTLRNLILENPELPVLIFCGAEAWSGEWGYEQAEVHGERIQELTLYNEQWLDKDDYEDALSEVLYEDEEYKDLSEEQFSKMIEQKVSETEFVKAIVIYVG